MSTTEPVALLLAELRDAVSLEGFGCACMPKVKCATCRARDVLAKVIAPIINKYTLAAPTAPTEDVRDAQRYRWLRVNPVHCANFADDQTYGMKKNRPEEFDAAVDEQIMLDAAMLSTPKD